MTQRSWSKPAATSRSDKLMRKNHSVLVNYLSTKLRDVSDAEDLAQDTFVRLMELEDSGEDIRNPPALMFSVARNLSLDLLRRNVRTQRIFADVDQEKVHAVGDSCDGDFSSPERSFESRQYEALVDQALSPLSSKCRAAFRLAKIEGWTYPEIAKTMNLSVSMIEKYVSRTLLQLRTDPNVISALAARPPTTG